VNLPDALVDALEADRLVAFVGAGLSMGDPSNLPNFEQLTALIAAGTGLEREKAEPLDRFLGRIDRQTVNVHQRACELLDVPDSLPTETHRATLRLFREPGLVRIVTTNLDQHFERSWPDVFAGSPIERYSAPALPLGRDLRGIVHVHGSITEPSRSVLADSDFGRAYVTEAWATRFLSEVFREFTVLFLGYSHEDILVDYLARALPGGEERRRFALVGSTDDPDRWRGRGIEPIHYDNSDGSHSAVQKVLSAWADEAAMTLAEHSGRMRDIVSVPPAEEVGEEAECVRDAFRGGESDIRRAKMRSFFDNAKDIEWLAWADREGLLQPLFVAESHDGAPLRGLAWWAASFAPHAADELLRIIAQKGGAVSPLFWTAIAQTLHATDDLQPGVLRAWAPILVEHEPRMGGRDSIEYLLDKCSLPEDSDALLHMLEHLLTPAPHLESSLLFGKTPRVSARLRQGGHWVREAFDGLIRPNLAQLASNLAIVLASSLERAHRLESIGPGNHFDVVSFSRSAIEPHEQDGLDHSGFGIVIDMSREIADWASAEDPTYAEALFGIWSRSEAPIVRRLSLYLLVRLPSVTDEAKLEHVLAIRGIADRPLKHEVYMLLSQVFGEVSAEAQAKLVDQARDYALEIGDEESRDHFLFNLMGWLAEADPASEPVQRVLAEVSERHPGFERREHPDLSSWHSGGGFAGEQSPISEQELRSLEFEDLLTKVVPEAEGANPLLDAIANVARDEFDWGMRLCEKAIKSGAAGASSLIAATVAGWEKADTSVDRREQALSLLTTLRAPIRAAREVALLLKTWASASDHAALTPAGWEAGRSVAQALWPEIECEDWAFIPEDHGWYMLAINHSASQLVLFWLNYLAALRKAAGEPDWQIPDDVKARLEEMAGSTSQGGIAARAELLSQFSFLHDVDTEWTASALLPMLDPASPFVEEAWDGLLSQGRRSPAAWSALVPAYHLLVGSLEDRPRRIRERTAHQAAFLCGRVVDDPIELGLVFDCIRAFDAEECGTFSRSLGQTLAKADAERLRGAWERWLHRYMHERGLGVPRAMEAPEYGALLEWPAEMPELFCELVTEIEKLQPAHVTERHGLLHRLKDDEHAETQPTCTLRLLVLALKATPVGQLWSAEDVVDMVNRAIGSGGDPARAVLVREELVRHGFGGAAARLEM